MGLTPKALVTAELLGLFGMRPKAAYVDFIAAGIDDNTRRTYDALQWRSPTRSDPLRQRRTRGWV